MLEVEDGPGPARVPARVSGRREARELRAGSPVEVMRVLTAARDRAELSNAQIARALGISQSAVTELIAGRKAPSVLLIVRWLGVCGWAVWAVER
jgi:transcriptional regulator with XRE-family HTH domain